jgi:hypothetical protein
VRLAYSNQHMIQADRGQSGTQSRYSFIGVPEYTDTPGTASPNPIDLLLKDLRQCVVLDAIEDHQSTATECVRNCFVTETPSPNGFRHGWNRAARVTMRSSF